MKPKHHKLPFPSCIRGFDSLRPLQLPACHTCCSKPGTIAVTAIRLAIVGLGKIARDQHLAAIAATAGIELAAVADPDASAASAGVARFASLEELLAAAPGIDAVALCTPPQTRQALAAAALRAGKHVLLE